MASLLSVATLLVGSLGADVPLATFDGKPGTTFDFKELNDPVMGGQSTGSWHVEAAGLGVFDGQVVDVPSLKAPGFIKAAADGSFPDVSSTATGELVLEVRSSTPEYQGFRVSFASGTLSPSYACAGGGSLPMSRGCYKAKFQVPSGSNFSEVRVPFREFSDKWSPATGEQTTTCAQDASVCPTAQRLAAIKRLEVWAEGALGKIHLEIKSISARSAPSLGAVPLAFNTCKSQIQRGLRYNISSRTELLCRSRWTRQRALRKPSAATTAPRCTRSLSSCTKPLTSHCSTSFRGPLPSTTRPVECRSSRRL